MFPLAVTLPVVFVLGGELPFPGIPASITELPQGTVAIWPAV
jgi:hypothetical protein